MCTSSERSSIARYFALSMCLASASVSAQEPSTTIETFNITSDRLSLPEARQAIAQIPGGATLVDMNKVSERNVSSLADALRYVPGVFSESANGSEAVFLSSRGSNLDATDYDMNGIKLLQDGLPITTADGNNHNRLIDPLSARYATVARGANALTYGASTLGGAIDFISPTARDSEPVEVLVNGGSYGQLQGRATVSGEFGDQLDGLLTVEGKAMGRLSRSQQTDRYSAYGNAGWQVADGVTTRLYGTYIDNDEELAGSLSAAQVRAGSGSGEPRRDRRRLSVKVENVACRQQDDVADRRGQQPLRRLFVRRAAAVSPDRRQDHGRLRRPGSQPAGRGIQPADRHRPPRRRRDGALRPARRRARPAVRPQLRRRLGGRHTTATTAATATASPRRSTTRRQRRGLCDGSLAVRRPLDAGRRRAGRGRRRDAKTRDVATGATSNPQDDYYTINPRLGVMYALADDATVYANVSRLYEPPTNFELEDDVAGNSQRSTRCTAPWWRSARAVRQPRHAQQLGMGGARLSGVDPRRDPVGRRSERARHQPDHQRRQDDSRRHRGAVDARFALDDSGTQASSPLLSLTLNDFSFDDDPVYGNNQLPAAPDYLVRGELLYRHANGFFAGPTFDVIGKRYADFANSYTVDSYNLLGFRAGWDRETWRVYAEVHNVLDENYIATIGVRDAAAPDAEILNPGMPRAAFVGVQARL